MKKIGIGIIVLLFVTVLSSCHMNEKCPAYTDNSEQTEQNG